MIKPMKFTLLSLLSIFIILSANTSIGNKLTSQPRVKNFINHVAKKYKYSPAYVKSLLNRAHYNPIVIKRMGHPYEAEPWYKYQKLFLTEDRIEDGINYWDKSNKLVSWEEKEYGVPGSIILAIIGIESKYGQDMGHFKELDTLSTLAFYFPERAQFFQSELGSFIALTKTYRIHPLSVTGSYAGAMGQCQFMPSSYLHFAVDFHGKGRPNLFRDKADVIFSVGNYLRQNGWEKDEPIATPARVTSNAFKHILKKDHNQPMAPKFTLHQLARYGVTPMDGVYNQGLKANLISLKGAHGPEYWIVFHNFYVITTYNRSDLYAMAAFQLSQKLQEAWEAKQNSRE